MRLESQLDTRLFTSSLNRLTYSSASESVRMVVTAGDDVVYDNTLYFYGGLVDVLDMGRLLENVMVEKNQYCMSVRFSAQGSSGDNLVKDFTVLYCSHVIEGGSALATTLMTRVFLTNATSRRLYRGCPSLLHFFLRSGDSHQLQYRILYSKDGVHEVKVVDSRMISSEEDTIRTISVSLSDLEDILTARNVSFDHIKSCSVKVGDRVCLFYVDQAPELEVFAFRNCYGLWEYVPLVCVTTRKTDRNKSEAVVNHQTVYYNLSVDTKFQVQTQPITTLEARWLEELVTSREVLLCDPSHPDLSYGVKVLVCDEDFSITNEDTTLNTVRFSWRFCDDRQHLLMSEAVKRFTSQYDYTFL